MNMYLLLLIHKKLTLLHKSTLFLPGNTTTNKTITLQTTWNKLPMSVSIILKKLDIPQEKAGGPDDLAAYIGTNVKVILCGSEQICLIVRYCYMSFKQF